MDCTHANSLFSGYLDAELSEAQAAPLRQHLMDCAACRARVQADKALSAWFVPESAVEVPPGFAARVTRRAFAGDLGRDLEARPRLQGLAATGRDSSLNRFLLQATAIAAGLLVVLAIGLGRWGRSGGPQGGFGTGGELDADDLNRTEALQRLEELNRSEEDALREPVEEQEGQVPLEGE